MQEPITTYTTAEVDLEALQTMGYALNMPTPQAVKFINTHFANLNLTLLGSISERTLSPLVRTGTQLKRDIEFQTDPETKLTFTLLNEDLSDSENDLGLVRTFYHQGSELLVEHKWFVIPEAKRSQGIARLTFRTWIQQYQNMGVSKIRVHTGLSDGGYVWAKNFFTADHRSEMDTILKKAKTMLSPGQLKAAQTLYDLYYDTNPTGTAFPIVDWAYLPFMVPVLRGTYWEGTMDFNNTEQISNFITYINK